MKNHSKVVLGLAAMLGISAGTAAVSGFAWFTTQRTASITSATYKVGAGGGVLRISEGTGNVNCGVTVNNGNSMAVEPDNHKLADVSSKDGKQFYKATLKTTNDAVDTYVDETAKKVPGATWMSAINTEQMVCVSWKVVLHNDAAGTKMDVYLSKEGSLFNVGGDYSEVEKFVHTVTEENKEETSFVLGVKSDVKSVKVDSTTLTKGALTNGYTFDAATKTVSLNGVTLAANNKVEIEYVADYSEYYRMAVLDKDENVVFFYTNSGHTDYVNVDEEQALAADTYATENLAEIATSAEGTAHPKQRLVSGLTNGTDVTLKFVVWCEGTATPFAAPLANAVTSEFLLVGLTA